MDFQPRFKRFAAGESFFKQLTAGRLNEILEFIEALPILPGVGYSVHPQPGGQVLNIRDLSGGGGHSGSRSPWDITLAAAESGYTATLRPGSINQLVPGNMFDEFGIAATGTYHVKLSCASDGKVITSCSLVVNGAAAAAQTPVAGALPASFEHTVGIIHDAQPFNIAAANLTATGSRLFLADKDTPAGPGEMAYVEWLVWSVTGPLA